MSLGFGRDTPFRPDFDMPDIQIFLMFFRRAGLQSYAGGWGRFSWL